VSVFDTISVSSLRGYSTDVTGRLLRIAVLHDGDKKVEVAREKTASCP
jgi:hypothetical protein